MKKVVPLILACLGFTQLAAAQDVFTYLAGFQEVASYGFADSNGNTKTPGKYNLIMRPVNGICRVWAGQTSSSDYMSVRYGYCLPNGVELVPPMYIKGEDFYEGLAQVANGNLLNGYKNGYINTKGLVQIPLQYVYAKQFSQGLAPVATAEKEWKFIDKNGTVKIAGPYLDADIFSEGLAGVSVPYDMGHGVMSFRKGYIDMTGKMVIQPEYNYVMPFNNGIAVVSFSGSTPQGYKSYQLLIDKTGKRLTKDEYIQVYHIPCEGLYPVKISGSSGLANEKDVWGVVDSKGVLQGVRYKYQPYFSEGLMVFQKDSLYGYMDKNGTVIIKPAYKNALHFNEGLAAVRGDNGSWGYINKKGEMVIRPAYVYAGRFSEGLAIVATGKSAYDNDLLTGAIDKTGKLILPMEKRKLGDFKNGKSITEDNYITYYVYKNGKNSLSCDLNTLVNSRYAYAALLKNDVKGALDWLQKNDGKKCAMSDYWLAYILLQVPPPTRDTVKGSMLMEQAAKNGYPEAMYSAGFMYNNGMGGRKDEALAKQWLVKAGKAGVPVAYTMLGTLEEKANPSQALVYYQQAADLGEPVAMYNLSLLYRDGRGVTKNDYQFSTWLNLSAQRNYQPAKQLQQLGAKAK